MSIMKIMNIIEIMQKYELKYPNSAVDGLVQYLRDFVGGKKVVPFGILPGILRHRIGGPLPLDSGRVQVVKSR